MSMKKKVDGQLSLHDCLLCGSRASCIQIKINDQEKWAQNFCKLNDIDIDSTMSEKDRLDIMNLVQTAIYCSYCFAIAKLYKSIDDINAQLKAIQLKWESKLKNWIESFQVSQETENQNYVRKKFENSKLNGEKRKRDDDFENFERKQRLLQCMRFKGSPVSVNLGMKSGLVDSSDSSSCNFADSFAFDVVEDGYGYSNDDEFQSSILSLSIIPDTNVETQTVTYVKVESDAVAVVDLDQEPVPEASQSPLQQTDTLNFINEIEAESPHIQVELIQKEDQAQLNQEQADDTIPDPGVIGNDIDIDHDDNVEISKYSKAVTFEPYKDLKAKFNLKDFSINIQRLLFANSNSTPNSNSSSLRSFSRNKSRTKSKRQLKNQRKSTKTKKSDPQIELCDSEFNSVTIPNPKPKVKIFRNKFPIKFYCSHSSCKIEFATESLLREHITHSENHEQELKYPYNCYQCQKPCRSFKQWLYHGNIHRGLMPFKCSEKDCSRSFATLTHLHQHRRRTHDSPRFQCETCGKAFPFRYCLNVHMKIHEKFKERNYKKTRETDPLFRCEKCGKTYVTKSGFKNHLITHDETKLDAVSCKDCDRVFHSKHGLKKHILEQHTKEFKFRCTVSDCDFGAADKGTLQRHLATVHSDARPFVCDICQHTFKTQYYLNSHEKRVHPPSKDFLCDVCGKGFSNKRYLQEHEETHKLVKSFLCPLCGREFTQRTSLTIHLRKVHPEDGGAKPGSLGGKGKNRNKMSNGKSEKNLAFDMAMPRALDGDGEGESDALTTERGENVEECEVNVLES